jgi:hypothetical protein
MTKGSIFIASMKMRGKHALHPPQVTVVNVTSMNPLHSQYRRDFSPLSGRGYAAPDGRTYLNFEHFWQGGKAWFKNNQKIQGTREFFLKATKPTRRFPRRASAGAVVKHAQWDIPALSHEMGYVESRKKVYVPYYHTYMKDSASIKLLKERVDAGESVVVYDFDGPRLGAGERDSMGNVGEKDGDVACVPVSLDLLVNKINDEKYPFGHGYVMAALLAGIPYEQFTSSQ